MVSLTTNRTRFNQDIRDEATRQGVFLWQVAEQYGCTDSNFSRKLRHELPDEEKERIRTIIEELAQGGETV